MKKKQEQNKKETASTQSETKQTVEPLEDKVLAIMKTLRENGVPITSTLLRDKLSLDKESGRDQIRRIAKRLEKDGKITISEKTVGEQKQYVYRLT